MMRAAAPQAARWATLALILAAVPVPTPAHARIYTCEAESGRVILRDVPCKRSEAGREQEVKREAPPAARAPETHNPPKQAQKLNEAQVKEVAQNLDAAFAKRDIKSLLALLAADAVVEMEIRLPATVQVVRYTREDYTARLREGFRLGNEFIYERSRSDIMMSPGEEHGEIVAWARQSFWFGNQWQEGDTRSRWGVEMREGRPQITLLRAVVTAPQEP
jgi:hypothetical protein